MKYLYCMLILSGAVYICAQRSHELSLNYGCFENSDTRMSVTLDGEEVFYADFEEKRLIWNSRVPIYARVPIAYNDSVRVRSDCKTNVERWKQDPSARAKPKEAPEILIYSRDEEVENEENTLICFMNHFFPPSINIKWTKNSVEETVEDALIRYLPNPDGTFYVFSYANFVPRQGDIYSCTVEHEALEQPETKFWEVDTNKIVIGPSVFCGLGLTLGLLGVSAGTFFFFERKPVSQHPKT
ncbi:H-2 class II histocompatibility antigen, A-Q alpha chain-like [Anabas testudineus]|uniref:Ig-like domain-containing protein n=1 Tax=Anabas testudineus TaxID=64144 RepID=A0A3Q1JWT3_ANATE|nr:H-2 class II histocompatibility antigen, A-Q alpha chain-like [Anabas testudineus]